MKKLHILLFIPFLFLNPGCSQKDTEKTKESGTESQTGSASPADESALSRKNYYLIFDGSGSMRGDKITTAREAVRRFIQLIPADANIGLAAFDSSGSSERSSLGSDRDHILSQVNSISAGGATPLGAAIEIAHTRLAEQSKFQRGYGEYNLVIITDGQATDNSRMIRSVEKVLKNTPIVIHAIGFHIGAGHPLNQPGRTYYRTANNFEELSKGLENVLAESEEFIVTDFKE